MNALTQYGKRIIDDLVNTCRGTHTVDEKHKIYDNLGVQLFSEGSFRSVFIDKHDTKNPVLTSDAVIKIDNNKGNVNNKLEILNYLHAPPDIKQHFLPITSYDREHGSWLIMPRAYGEPNYDEIQHINDTLYRAGIADIARVGFGRLLPSGPIRGDINKENCGIYNGNVYIYDYSVVFYTRIEYRAIVEKPLDQW
jgi:hypothetical protein